MTSRLAAAALSLSLLAAPVAVAGGDPDPAPIFKARCAVCHGLDGKGQTPAGKALKVRDLGSPEVQQRSDAELAATIAEGKGKMPAFKSTLGAGDIEALVGLIRTLEK